MKTHILVYCSIAVKGLTFHDLEHLATRAQVYNLRNDITGMLLYSGDNFIQALEGRLPALELLMEKIVVDERHHQFERLLCAPIVQRRFGRWALGVLDASESADLDRDKLRFICGQAEADPASASRAALTALKIFRKDLGRSGVQKAA